jgi:hypothetical protein
VTVEVGVEVEVEVQLTSSSACPLSSLLVHDCMSITCGGVSCLSHVVWCAPCDSQEIKLWYEWWELPAIEISRGNFHQ